MARSSYPFWTHDTVAAAVLAGVGGASLQIKLDALANILNIPVVTACLQGWPMLLILAGVVMLLVQPAAGDRPRRREDGEVVDAALVRFSKKSPSASWTGQTRESV